MTRCDETQFERVHTSKEKRSVCESGRGERGNEGEGRDGARWTEMAQSLQSPLGFLFLNLFILAEAN